MNEIHDLAGKVKGFLDESEGRRLYETALAAAELGPCLEIGGYCGKSTVYLGLACRETGGVLFSVDHHRGSEEQQPGEEYFDPETLDQTDAHRIDTFPLFRKTLEMAGLENTVVPMVCRSDLAARMWTTPLGLVFIDGGHSREAAFADYHGWAGKLSPNGYLLIHDIFKDPSEGGQAPYEVFQAAIASGRFRELPMTKTLGVLRRL